MSHKLLILAQDETKYRALIEEARLANLELTTQPAEDVDIVLGEPSRIKAALASLPALSWVQSIWAGIEPLVGPASRRDYVLTNAREVFGGLISEYVIGYLLAHERKIFQKLEAQKNKHWDESDTGTLQWKNNWLAWCRLHRRGSSANRKVLRYECPWLYTGQRNQQTCG